MLWMCRDCEGRTDLAVHAGLCAATRLGSRPLSTTNGTKILELEADLRDAIPGHHDMEAACFQMITQAPELMRRYLGPREAKSRCSPNHFHLKSKDTESGQWEWEEEVQ
jgi:hypothetical protein